VIPEAPFLFAIAGLSASLAGLAGLVAALRRGADLRPVDAFRLREIVEFAFANMLAAVGIVPLAALLPGGIGDAIRIASTLALIFALGSSAVLVRRIRGDGIAFTRAWQVAAAAVVAAIVFASIAAIVAATMPVYQVLLVLMLARPMLAFVLVLASFEVRPGDGP
jgi:hypothetical protein